MTRRRRAQAKGCVLALTSIAVSTGPMWSFSGFLYLCGLIAAIVGVTALVMLLEFYRGFRAFERWTANEAKRLLSRPRPRAVLPWGRR